ncbi:MAG: addiction module protein [Betaproteobacteria bacterium HGW-Betaproteobacteria-18]|nr:MAG: addiction module protein [Betaproteobacteria bacterium HGW-Betaproteobacteria-18]
MAIKVEEYIREEASNPYKQWFDGLGEYVIDWGPGYRIYLAKDGDMLIVLFGGGTKRGQQRDLDRAKGLLAEYKVRKKIMAAKSSRKQKG